MKKFAILAIAIMLLPITANTATVQFDGDAGVYASFPGGVIEVVKGQTWCHLDPDGYDDMGLVNFAWLGNCYLAEVDTFCAHTYDDLGWETYSDHEECFLMETGYIYWVSACITVPCDAALATENTFYFTHAFCDIEEVCQPEQGDCIDPTVFGPDRWQTVSQDFIVVESPPSLFVLQDTLYEVSQGQTGAYIPFSICNGDPCNPDINYGYIITSRGRVGAAIYVEDTADLIPGGECQPVYGVIDAGAADICDYDTLTIIVWQEDGSVYDTCVQRIHVIEALPVPLFTAPVVTILVLAMILAAAVIMKRHAVSKA